MPGLKKRRMRMRFTGKNGGRNGRNKRRKSSKARKQTPRGCDPDGGGGGVLHALTRFAASRTNAANGLAATFGKAVSDVGTIDPIDAPVAASG